MLGANIDALNYEVGRTGPDDLKPLADNDWSKDFVAGVVDVKSTVTETADEVADRIRSVLEFVPAERLGLSHRLRSDQPAADDRGGQAAGTGRRRRHRACGARRVALRR